MLDIQRSYFQNWNICCGMGTSNRTDVWPIRTVASSKHTLKMKTVYARRKSAAENWGSLFKSPCQNSSECREETRGERKKNQTLVIGTHVFIVLATNWWITWPSYRAFPKLRFSDVPLLQSQLKSSVISPAQNISHNHGQLDHVNLPSTCFRWMNSLVRSNMAPTPLIFLWGNLA